MLKKGGTLASARVGIDVVTAIAGALEALDVRYDIRVASAHRTPQRVMDIVSRAEAAGVRVTRNPSDMGKLMLEAMQK